MNLMDVQFKVKYIYLLLHSVSVINTKIRTTFYPNVLVIYA